MAELMEEHIDKLAFARGHRAHDGLSRRQIERLFRRYLDCVPKRYYLEMRLRRARELLLQTAMPIMDVTTSCGFKSPPHPPAATGACSAIPRAWSASSPQ